ncbi:MAG: type II secretion system secretin GspD [Desulfovibrionales bacterium]|nr:type II secretion system secretin GspD [Desulfovibrionales bacterium]
MDFKKVDVHVLIKFISELTGKNFIVDKRVKGKVTIYSPSKVSVQEAYRVFESVLEVHNYAIVPSGRAYKIVPVAIGRTQGVPTITSDNGLLRPAGDELVTQLIPLRHSSATELAKILPKLVGANGLVSVYPPNNSLIITAPYANIKQALSLVREVDKKRYAPQLRSFSLENGDAKSIATNLSKLLTTKLKQQANFGKKGLGLIQADERTNTVLALADSETMKTVMDMIQILDIKTPAGKGDIHFRSLDNAKAEDVAKVLNSLIERRGKSKNQKILSKEVKIVADQPTNSLVITARPDDFAILSETINKLDVQRKQVFIEALIMEASSDSSFSFGVNWAGGSNVGEVYLFGSSNSGGGGITLPPSEKGGIVGFPSGGSIGAIIEDAFSIGGTSYSIQSILSAVEGDNDYTVLATPQLLTLDNQEARVDVVDNVPFIKESTVKSDFDISTQTIDYKDVGVKLQLTPRISSDGTMQLEVKQEVSRVLNSLLTLTDGQQLVAPTTRKREVETTIRMKDGQTAVIAGLLSEDDSKGNSKTPGLGDVPFFGWLFKQKTVKNNKTNLLIFITPHVINTFEDAERLTRAKKFESHAILVGDDGAGLPLMSKPRTLDPILIQ